MTKTSNFNITSQYVQGCMAVAEMSMAKTPVAQTPDCHIGHITVALNLYLFVHVAIPSFTLGLQLGEKQDNGFNKKMFLNKINNKNIIFKNKN